MDAGLGLQPAVRVVALDDDRRRFDAGFVAGGLLHHLDVEFASLAPAHVHAQQHARPVAALGAAGARVHFDISVVAVRLARQQRLDLAAFAFDLEGAKLGEAFGLGFGVAFDLAEFDEGHRVVKLALHLGERAEAILQHRTLAHQLLRGVGVVPEARVFRLCVEFG
jgi:hypothetical protein